MNTSIKATRLNAISTLISGLGILTFHQQLADVFNYPDTLPFLIVGGVITFFSLTMFVELKKQRALAILWIITQDTLFTLSSIVVIVIRPFEISDTGYLLIGLFLIPILFFIVYQSLGLIRMDRKEGSAIKVFRFSRRVRGELPLVWKIISDVGNYHEVAPNIDASTIVSGEGRGMVRVCSHGKDSWKETCSLWEPEKQFSFVVDTSAPDYPYPLISLQGNWSVKELNAGQTEITMEFEFEYKKSFQNLLLHPMMKHQFSKVCKDLLDNWQSMIEGK